MIECTIATIFVGILCLIIIGAILLFIKYMHTIDEKLSKGRQTNADVSTALIRSDGGDDRRRRKHSSGKQDKRKKKKKDSDETFLYAVDQGGVEEV